MPNEAVVDDGIKASAEAIADLVQAKPSAEPKKWEKQFAEDHPELAAAPKVKKAEVKSKLDSAVEHQVEEKEAENKKEEVKENKDEAKVASESEEKPAEERPQEEEEKPAKEESVDKGKTEKPSLDEIVRKYAEDNGITVEEAKADFEANDGILRKYADDPNTFPYKLAKAYRNQQQEYTKSKNHQQEANANVFAQQIKADPKGFINRAIEKHKDKLLADFRRDNPETAAIMSDGAIVEQLRNQGLANLDREIQKYDNTIKVKATERRDSLMSTLKEADKPFSGEIRGMLYKLPDQQVADPTFNFKDLVRWAKGDDVVISKMVKDAEERGYKRAKSEETNILGEQNKGSSTVKPVKKAPVSAAGKNLNDFQKKKAVEMFGSAYQTDEDCWDAYEEVVLKRKPKK
jgi:hypothetical protein